MHNCICTLLSSFQLMLSKHVTQAHLWCWDSNRWGRGWSWDPSSTSTSRDRWWRGWRRCRYSCTLPLRSRRIEYHVHTHAIPCNMCIQHVLVTGINQHLCTILAHSSVECTVYSKMPFFFNLVHICMLNVLSTSPYLWRWCW